MPGKQLLGMRVQLSVAAFNVTPLWQQFMPRRKAITQVVSDLLYSVSVYPPLYFEQFKPETTFEKWAAVEVSSLHSAPEDMEHLLLPGGTYAVFRYKSEGGNPAIFQYIYGTWLPASNYRLSPLPHFEILDKLYLHGHPDSEETICIPVQPK